MKKYNVSIAAACPKDKQWKWVQESQNGFVVTTLGSTVKLEGYGKTEEEFVKILPLICEFTDHHVTVKEVDEDGEEAGQTSPTISA